MIVDFLLAGVLTESIKQRYCIKFCQKLGNNQAETIQKIQQAFGDEALSQTQIKEWFNRFKNGWMSVESEAHFGRLSTSRKEEVIEMVCQILLKDRRLTLWKIVEKVGISKESVHSILTKDLCMRRVLAKFIPELLMEQQKELRVEIAQIMLDCANNDLEFTKTILTGDETWAYGYYPETKFQSSQWKHPESPKPKKHDKFAAM